MTERAVRYQTGIDGIVAGDLAGGFFVGWPMPPSPELHLAMLRGSEAVVLAIDDAVGAGAPEMRDVMEMRALSSRGPAKGQGGRGASGRSRRQDERRKYLPNAAGGPSLD